MKPDGRDLHVYGGLGLLAIGAEILRSGLGLAIAGALLFYVRVWRF